MPSPIVPFLLLAGGILHLVQGIRTILYPAAFLSTFGLSPDAPAVDLAPAYGGRNVALSLTMIVLYWQGMYRAAGLMLICCTIGAAADTYVSSLALHEGNFTNSGPTFSHLTGLVVLSVLGWGLVRLK